MEYNYFEIIKAFVDHSKHDLNYNTPWQVDLLDFAPSLLSLLYNPDKIFQYKFGFCGEVAFLRSWAYRDPDAVAEFAIELYKTGKSHIGKLKVKARNEFLKSTWMLYHYDCPITAAVWMICGSIADPSYDIFEGSPRDDAGTAPTSMVEWLKKTDLYANLENKSRHRWLRYFFKNPDIYQALKLKPDINTDVFIVIRINMFKNADSILRNHVLNVKKNPGHFIMLNEPISMVNGKVHMNIWTWGRNYQLSISKEDFNENYDGSIEAYSNKPKRTIPLKVRKLHLPYYQKILGFNDKIIETPKDEKTCYIQGIRFKKQGYIKKALECYDKVINFNPKNLNIWFEKGIALEKLGEYSEAVKAYDKVIEINPYFTDAWCNKGNILRKSGNFKGAIEFYDKALETNPLSSQSWYNKGIALGKLKNYREAVEVYTRAIELDPYNFTAINNKRIIEDKIKYNK